MAERIALNPYLNKSLRVLIAVAVACTGGRRELCLPC
jgi:hypothetical protein